ncbi:MAG: diadenylate cyclase CdaA [Lachnospiraceae bacterium]
MNFLELIRRYITVHTLDIRSIDIVEIIILAFIIYHIMLWIKNTRAWALLKGFAVILGFLLIAVIFRMYTILWIAGKIFNIGILAIVIVFQPELRRALEQLGQQNIISSLFSFDSSKEENVRISDRSVEAIVKASVEMSKARTGALIVIENNVPLGEYERTGITLEAQISSQLLLNIFEHNTPLHDGAIIVRGDRIVSATCYLPLSDNMELSKELGTRHRAAVGISEVSDALTVVVSEETGAISVSQYNELERNITAEVLRERLRTLQNRSADNKRFRLWKGRGKDEVEMDG